MKLLVPALLVGGGYMLITSLKNTGERLKKCEINSFKLGKLQMPNAQEMIIPVELRVFNPNNTDVPAEYFRGNVYRAGVKIGDFTFNSGSKNVMLKARSETPLTFQVRVTTIGAVRTIVDIFKNLLAARPIDSVFKIEGILAIGGFDIPVLFNYDVKTNKLLNSNVAGIGKPYVKLEFDSNDALQKHFKHCKTPPFSLNGI